MSELDNESKDRISAEGLRYISQYSLRHLLLHHIVKYRKEGRNGEENKIAVSKFLKYFKKEHEINFKKLNICTQHTFSSIIFTDDSKIDIRDEVEHYDCLDISSLGNILWNCPFFPSCREQVRDNRNLNCTGTEDGKECSKNSCTQHPNKQHLFQCSYCGRNRCEGPCCISVQCDHPCKCGVTKEKSKENSTVCCFECMVCFNCMIKDTSFCKEKDIKSSIKVLVDFRNYVAHSIKQLWILFESTGDYHHSFHGRTTFKEIYQYVASNIMKVLDYLRMEGQITERDHSRKQIEIYDFEDLIKEDLLRKYGKELLSTYKPYSMKIILDLEVGQELPKNYFQLYANDGLMDRVIDGLVVFVKDYTGADQKTVKIERKCMRRERNERPDKSHFKMKIEVSAITPEGKKAIDEYSDRESEKCRNFMTALQKAIETGLLHEHRIKVTVIVEDIEFGSIFIYLDICKHKGTPWHDAEIKSIEKSAQRYINNIIKSATVKVTLAEYPIDEIKLIFNAIIQNPNDVSYLLDKESLTIEAERLARQYISNLSETFSPLETSVNQPDDNQQDGESQQNIQMKQELTEVKQELTEVKNDVKDMKIVLTEVLNEVKNLTQSAEQHQNMKPAISVDSGISSDSPSKTQFNDHDQNTSSIEGLSATHSSAEGYKKTQKSNFKESVDSLNLSKFERLKDEPSAAVNRTSMSTSFHAKSMPEIHVADSNKYNEESSFVELPESTPDNDTVTRSGSSKKNKKPLKKFTGWIARKGKSNDKIKKEPKSSSKVEYV